MASHSDTQDNPWENWRGYRTDHLLDLNELMPKTRDWSWITAKEKCNVPRSHNCGSKHELAKKIFKAFMKIVVADIIVNDNCFSLPVKGLSPRMFITPVRPKENEFIKKHPTQEQQAINLFGSKGEIYVFKYTYRDFNGRARHKRIRLDKRRRLAIIAQGNNGKHYLQR